MNFWESIYENRPLEGMALNSRAEFPPKKSGSGAYLFRQLRKNQCCLCRKNRFKTRGAANKKDPTLSRKALKNVARPTGFEPVTTAFGGHRYSAFVSRFNRPKSGKSNT